MVLLGNLSDTDFTHSGKIHGCYHGIEAVVGTDIGRGFSSFDMLLPGCKGQNISIIPIGILCSADEPARQVSHHFFAPG